MDFQSILQILQIFNLAIIPAVFYIIKLEIRLATITKDIEYLISEIKELKNDKSNNFHTSDN